MKARGHQNQLEREATRHLKSKASIAFAFVGLVIAGDGVLTLLGGMLHYPNSWGAPVFAPFALVIGVLAIVAAVGLRSSSRF